MVVSYCQGRPRLVLVNCLEGLSLPRNSTTINWPARHDLVVDWAVKSQHKQIIIITIIIQQMIKMLMQRHKMGNTWMQRNWLEEIWMQWNKLGKCLMQWNKGVKLYFKQRNKLIKLWWLKTNLIKLWCRRTNRGNPLMHGNKLGNDCSCMPVGLFH